MKFKKVIFVPLSSLILLLSACVPNSGEGNIDNIIENGGAYEKEIEANEELTEETEADKGESEKLKVMSTYNLKANSENLEDNVDSIIQKTHSLGGYVSLKEIRDVDSSKDSLKKAKITLRVPKENVVELTNEIKATILVLDEEMNSANITDNYYDIQERIEGLKSRERKLSQLYNDSEDIKSTLEIEEKLSEIEKLKEEEVRKKFNIENRIKFSSIEIDLKEVESLPKAEEVISNEKKIDKAFSVTKERIENVLVGIFVFIIKSSPIIAIVVIAAFIVYRFRDKIFISKNERELDDKQSNENSDNKDNDKKV